MTAVREAEPVEVDRFSPAHYEPERVPREVLRHRGTPDTLGVGRPGKVGLLELGFARVGARTELVRRFQKSPLQIMRPLYIDPLRPDLPVVYLMSTGGGILQADRLRTDIDCGADASVLVTTQAATKVHRMDRDYATQLVHLTAGRGAYLEYLPGPIIPYGGTRIYQRTVVTADPAATVLIAETVLAGRLARGERHDYHVVASDLEIARPGAGLVAVDAVRLDPGRARVTGPGVLAGHTLMSTFYAVSPLATPAAIADALHDALSGHPVDRGVSVLPHDAGAWVRMLADDPPAVTAALGAAWDAVRQLLTGVPAPALRKT
ncbi:urease accessory protein UreD [Speluncibacter jeojiensis]|uniref:Urease accessory protein UreD n=1 Tax=Speluncibacter jeojiensis TaxID=2710754 RepID=A0A9X4M302_9ACTN|nr:urease accessory protein UreD [Rhodococcus sp. D2-41]MDG3016256.1 urease accessory protein UreD [Corynebacteriales bacterium D3-21]